MNNIFFSLFLFLCFLTPLKADETLEIALATETVALPFALIKSETLSSQAKNLVNTLENDLRLSGWFQLVRPDLKMSEINLDHPFAHPKLRSQSQMRYLLLIDEIEGQITPYLFDIQKKAHLKLKAPPHKTWVEDTRLAAHMLSNSIVKALTGHQGIAHCKILYAISNSNKKDSGTEVWLSDYDGHNAKKVFQSKSLIVTPSFIPQRGLTEFCYVSYKLGQPKLMWAEIGSGSKRISALGGNQVTPGFDSTGLQLAFVSDCAGNPDIYLMRIDPKTGTSERAQKLFGSSKGTQASPTFSPNGLEMALVSSKDGSPRIYIINVENSLKGENSDKARLISKKNRENTCPSWSPDGRFIAYSAKSQGPRQIWVYDCENQTETCLTQGDGVKENPSWGPDSLHLYYDEEDATGTRIYMIDLNLQKPQRISQGGRCQRFPSCSN